LFICYYTTFLNLLSPKVAIRAPNRDRNYRATAIGQGMAEYRRGDGWKTNGTPMGDLWVTCWQIDRMGFQPLNIALEYLWSHWTLPHLSYYGIFIPLILWWNMIKIMEYLFSISISIYWRMNLYWTDKIHIKFWF
jgi:hypothetical protein